MKTTHTYYLNINNTIKTVSILEAFPFLLGNNSKKPVISMVGGGGKTTTMYQLAEAFRKQGKNVLVTTSTHVQMPPITCADLSFKSAADVQPVYAQNIDEILALWKTRRISVIGTPQNNQKLSIPEPEFLKSAIDFADVVLIEADGAKCFPCKVPIEKEPVILPQCNIVIGLMGLDALGKPVKDICFRYEQAKAVFHFEEDHILCPEDLANILSSEQGTRKSVGLADYYVVLNKCDTPQQLAAANEIFHLLKTKGNLINQIVFSSHKD